MTVYLITLEDFRPAERFDSQPWTTARIDEAPSRGGPFTEIDSVTLDPVDVDPANPAARTFTVEGTVPAGWYRVTWVDAAGTEQSTEPTLNAPYRPTVRDVARVIPARTASGGGHAGTFTASTEPPASRVEEHIDDAAADIASRVGLDLPEPVHGIARRVIALGAALLVELGADDFNRDRYDGLKRLYDDRLAELTESAQEALVGGDPGDVDDVVGPLGIFPAATCDGWRAPGTEVPWP